MFVLKFADAYTPQDLARYLITRAAEDGRMAVTEAEVSFTRGYARLFNAYKMNAFLLVAVTNSLLRGGFIHQVGLTDKLLATAVFDVEVRNMGGIDQPWKYLYFRRFMETAHEAEFYGYWLGLLADASEAPSGSVAQVGTEVFSTWVKVQHLAMAHLEKAIKVVRERLVGRGSLKEWPDFPEAPRVRASSLIPVEDRPVWED